MGLYAGIDLHSNNNYLAITDDQDKHVYEKRLPNEPDVVLVTGRIHLPERRPADAGSIAEKGTSGATEDLTHQQSARDNQPKLWLQAQRQ